MLFILSNLTAGYQTVRPAEWAVGVLPPTPTRFDKSKLAAGKSVTILFLCTQRTASRIFGGPSAITVFFRQAMREQSIPFELKPYDDYYAGERLSRVLHSIEQIERGEIVTKTLAELKVMEND